MLASKLTSNGLCGCFGVSPLPWPCHFSRVENPVRGGLIKSISVISGKMREVGCSGLWQVWFQSRHRCK